VPRHYARLLAELADHPKWLDLSALGRSAWITLYLRAIPSEGRLKSLAHCEMLLRRDRIPTPAKLVQELVDGHLLDVADDGSVGFHDFETHQPIYRGPSDDPEAVRERMRRLRAERKAQEAAVRDVRQDVRDVRVSSTGSIDKIRGEEIRGNASSGTNVPSVRVPHARAHEGDDDEWVGAAKLVEELTGRVFYNRESRAGETLTFDLRDFGAKRVHDALRKIAEVYNGQVYDGAQLIFAAHKLLAPIPNTRQLEREESQQQREAAEARRTQRAHAATAKYLEEQRRFEQLRRDEQQKQGGAA
jgi:hypothetical protein